jgi:Flp pilus assembly protein TadB
VGLILLFFGVYINIYEERKLSRIEIQSNKHKKIIIKIDKLTSVFPLNHIKKRIEESLTLRIYNDYTLKMVSSIICLVLAVVTITFAILMRNIGQLWYVKLVVLSICAFLPYYLFSLVIEIYSTQIGKQIPVLIDEFRSAFINKGKIEIALADCAENLDKSMKELLNRVIDSSDYVMELNKLKDRLNNQWFNIFVTLIINFRENSGDLVTQLYNLNSTITNYNNMEKKKNKRLIWYEIFAVGTTIIGIPGIIYVNSKLINASMTIDPDTNMTITRIIIYAIFSLLVVRIIRKVM